MLTIREKRVKSFPSLTAHRAALISVPLALSQTPVYIARPRILGQCIVRCVRLLPHSYAGTKLYCLVAEAHGCEQLAQSCYLIAARPGIELTTFRSRIQRPNHYATKPPCTAAVKTAVINK